MTINEVLMTALLDFNSDTPNYLADRCDIPLEDLGFEALDIEDLVDTLEDQLHIDLLVTPETTVEELSNYIKERT